MNQMKKLSKWLKKYFIPHEGNEFKPHFLRHETMLGFFFLVIILELGFLVQVFVVFDKTKFLAEVLPAVLENLTNQERAQNNINPLKENALLDKAAEEKAQDMAKNGYFAHTSPEGKTPWYWFDQVGYNYIYAGENLAVNFFESNDVAQAWMNSPTHRANILKSDYTEIGIGVARGVYEGRDTVFVAQLFGKPLVFPTAVETSQASNTKVATSTPTVSATKPATTSQTTAGSKPATKSTPPTKAPAPVKTTPVNTQPVNKTSTEQPATNPVIQEASPLVASAPAPTAVQVLGEESTTNPAAPVVTTEATAAPQSAFRSFLERILTAPRTTLTYAYEALGLLVLLALIIAFAMSERHHKRVMARGFALIAIILALSYVNLRVLNVKTQVPTDDHNMTASAINAFPK